MKTRFFDSCTTLEEVKKKYRDLAKLYHPDKGGDLETMQKLNAEYDKIINSGKFEFKNKTEHEEAIKYKDLIAQLVVLDGLIIEVIGYWVWLSGNTKAHKEKLKELKFFWSHDKQMWYWRPESWAKVWNRSKPMDMDEIRRRFNSQTFTGKEEKENKQGKPEKNHKLQTA